MRRYLVVGLAKTGTTVISQTIKNSIGATRLAMEPKVLAPFEKSAAMKDAWVAKILYAHWEDRPNLLRALILDELNVGFDANIVIVRDPRAALVSRLLYLAHPYFRQRERSADEEREWIDLYRRLETDRDFSALDLFEALKTRFGVGVLPRIIARDNEYAGWVASLPANRKAILRYEDFVTGQIAGHPCADVLSGDRTIPADLERTRRTGGLDDWRAYYSAAGLAWLDTQFGGAVEAMGYPRRVEPGGEIDPAHCSRYVERLIADARARQAA